MAGNNNQEQNNKEMEESVWSVRINSQTLFKKPLEGRTVLLGMTAEDNKKVAEVLDKAFDELAKILEHKTTMHEAPLPKEQVTTVDSVKSNPNSEPKVTGVHERSEEPVENKAVEEVVEEVELETEDKDVEDTADDEKEKLKVEKNKKGGSVKNFWDRID